MNQVLKNSVYRIANQEQIDYIAQKADLLPEEEKILNLWHKGENDLDIMEEIGMSKNAYEATELIIKTKVAVSVFGCIDRCKWEDERVGAC